MSTTIYAPKLKDKWRAHYKVCKYFDGGAYERMAALGLYLPPDEVCEDEGNLLATIGATDLFNGLTTAGLATPYNSTNTQIAVGDSSTAASVGQTDLQAAVGTKLNAADPTGATNATPIVVTATYSPTPVTGQVVVCSAFSGAGGAAINQTFEITAASGSVLTLLNSAGGGAITLTGGLVKPINYYRQLINGAPVVSTNTCVITSVFASANGNFAWNEWEISNSGAATNKQAQPPTHQFDRVVQSFGTKASGNVWTITVTLSLA